MEDKYLDEVYFFLEKRNRTLELDKLKDKDRFISAVKWWMDLGALREWTFDNDYTKLFKEAQYRPEWPNTNLYTRI